MRWVWLTLKVFVGLVLFSSGVVLFSWTFDREPPRELRGYRIETPRVAPGEPMRMTWDLYLKRNCPGTAHRSVVSLAHEDWSYHISNEVNPEPVPDKELPIRRQIHVHSFTMPHDAPPGPAIYRINIDMHCNPLHWMFPIRIHYDAIPIEIVPRPAKVSRVVPPPGHPVP